MDRFAELNARDCSWWYKRDTRELEMRDSLISGSLGDSRSWTEAV